MRWLGASLAAVILLPVGWMAAASAIYCAMTGNMDLYRFPWTQWAQAAPWWRLNGWMTLSVCLSAAIPTIVLLICAYGIVRRLFFGLRQPSLYGKTGWADRKEMQRGGIKSERTPF